VPDFIGTEKNGNFTVGFERFGLFWKTRAIRASRRSKQAFTFILNTKQHE
jgi:hypothetical protein